MYCDPFYVTVIGQIINLSIFLRLLVFMVDFPTPIVLEKFWDNFCDLKQLTARCYRKWDKNSDIF
ncbi:hypothetical protein PL9214710026 [Planktothrix tepida PCC 9214]|uniref:Uncharacterized protein n=1 Tax=Planktothrix tepida PCC 9214 TaxID=671072 RepID=A0A1J1LVL1_9CYAN|nr:hypothetical protein PL9214710026 [Planktothrix tepida PCC 9214]